MEEAINMEGKVILITGATDGIGKEAARALAGMGANVVVVGRNPEKTEYTITELIKTTNNNQVDYLLADLTSQAQIRKLAEDFLSGYDRLDVLVNCAGNGFLTRKLTEDGIERTFALNHLSYFLLTNLLLDKLVESAPARIVNVASNSHFRGKIRFDDYNFERGYFIMRAYQQSKLANVMFTYELSRHLEGKGVTANVMHPGLVNTNIGRSSHWFVNLVQPLIFGRGISPEEGAETIIYLASSPNVEGVTGKYFYKKEPMPTLEASYDEALQKRLWELSEKLVRLG